MLTEEEITTRVRSLLKCASMRGRHAQPPAGKKNKDHVCERWKELFLKYDADGSGALCFKEIRLMCRKDLKLSDRTLPDADLKTLFKVIDADGSGEISFDEFYAYVQQGSKEDAKSAEEILLSVGRALRLALKRCGVRGEKDLYQMFEEFDMDGDGCFTPEEMRRFFRKLLHVTTHEVSDQNINKAYKSLDADGSRSLCSHEFVEFVQKYANPDASKASTSDTSKSAAGRALMRRYQAAMGVASAVPFCLNGRELPTRSRLGTGDLNNQLISQAAWNCDQGPKLTELPTATPQPLASSASAPSLPAASSAQGGRGSVAQLPQLAPSRPSSRSDSAAGGGALARSDRYLVLQGSKTLNRIEQRLFDAGVDVRGQLYRTQSAKSIF